MPNDEGARALDTIERLAAEAEIMGLKARYFRGVDEGDGDLVRSVLAADCVLDYRGCCTDPVTGRDYLPAMNVVLRGRDQWRADGMRRFGIVSVHQGHNFELDWIDDASASGIWSMTDRLWFPPGAEFALMTGHGHYRETYVREPDGWKIATTRVTRIRVEAV